VKQVTRNLNSWSLGGQNACTGFILRTTFISNFKKKSCLVCAMGQSFVFVALESSPGNMILHTCTVAFCVYLFLCVISEDPESKLMYFVHFLCRS
jgi:hypothetical protein